MTIAGPIATLLEMAALNNGFDRESPIVDGWLAFASTHVPLKVWLRGEGDADYVAALSQINVVRALSEHGEPISVSLPPGAAAARLVSDIPSMHRLLRRAFQLSKTLPDELLHAFQKKTANLPQSTEAERLVVQRVGQDIFRAGLLEYWDNCCPVTGLCVPELLRASHIKPWASCSIDAERLDVFNGLLLAPHLDAAFDRGLITFADDGAVIVSPILSTNDRQALSVHDELRIPSLAGGHRHYLKWHREYVFRANHEEPSDQGPAGAGARSRRHVP